MKRTVVIILTVVAIFFLRNEAFSQEEPSGRPCSDRDVVGVWSLVSIKPLIPFSEGDPDFMPHQIWAFTTGGKFVKMGKTTPISRAEYDPLVNTAESKPELLGTTYKVNEKRAFLKLQPRGVAQTYYFSCFVLTGDYTDRGKRVDMRTGDILLDLKSPDGQTLIGHLFRKVRQLK